MRKGSAFPVEIGRNKVTAGKFNNVRTVRCYEDGNLELVFRLPDGTKGASATEAFVKGEDMDLGNNIFEVNVTGGKFSFASSPLA